MKKEFNFNIIDGASNDSKNNIQYNNLNNS